MTGHHNAVSTGDFERGEQSPGEKVGCSLSEVPPGKRAWPRHYHLANEEAIFMLEGRVTLRIGEAEIAISEDDYAALPVGEAWVHQTINDSGAPPRYLCFSTMIAPDIMVYPDSNKAGIFGGADPDDPKERRTFSKFLKASGEAGYYEGEES